MLFHNERRNQGNKQPLMKGFIELTIDELKWAIEQAKQKKPIKLQVAVWQTPGANGAYLSGPVTPEIERKQENAPWDIGDELQL